MRQRISGFRSIRTEAQRLATTPVMVYSERTMHDDYATVLLEDIRSKLQGLAEAVSLLHNDIKVMKPQVALIPQMAADVETLKAVQADQGRELRYIETYLTTQGMPARA